VVDEDVEDFAHDRKDNRDLMEACGPMIEIVDGTLQFVHFSAKE
jgi:hypothetical protein